MAKAKRKSRGSGRLPGRVKRADIARLLKAAQMDGVKLVEFFPLGIPGPDGGWGVWHVRPDRVASLIERILKDRLTPGVKIFPKGIPWPEVFEVKFEVGSARSSQG
jgi:hypothetical protein